MDMLNRQQAERETQRAQANREELAERIAHAIPTDGRIEPLPGIRLYRSSSPTELLPVVSDPGISVIAQGSKALYLGEESYQYGSYDYCLGTLDLPVTSHIIEASPARPYLSLRLKLDPALVGSVMLEASYPAQPTEADVRALNVSPLDTGLLDAVVRLVRLLDAPTEAPILAPLVTREIVYRLLMGEQGGRLRYLAVLGGYTSPIARAVARLRENFDQPLRIDDIAREIGMSTSGFHHHFKAVTAMSPLQFQKRLRLQEARRLMLGERLDAASAGYRVGYDDASHFNREYKRLFGIPPKSDVDRLREAVRVTADV